MRTLEEVGRQRTRDRVIGQLGLPPGISPPAVQPERLGAGQPHQNDRLRLTGTVRERAECKAGHRAL